MCVSAVKSYKNHELSNPEPQITKSGLIYILLAFLFFVDMKVNVNFLVSNVYSWSKKLLQISHIIAIMFSGVVTVTVNILGPKASCSWGKGKYYKLFTYI